ncbi:MAG: HEAT repeat domain-containing protein [Parachlamydiaceae bacterium]|nr:HEAT repeat domain-containing protein [Parachlamydiaceae bacterium]
MEQKSLYHDSNDYRYNLDRLNDLNLPKGLPEVVMKQAERVACLMLHDRLTREKEGWVLSESVPTLASKQKQDLNADFGENQAFHNEFVPGFATAFLVTKQLALTTAHSLFNPNKKDSRKIDSKLVKATRLVFGFHGVKEKRSDYFFREEQVQTVTVVAYQHFRSRGRKNFYSEWSDWVLLKLDRAVTWDPLPLNLEKVLDKIELYMLGHPNGLPLKFTYNGMIKGNTEEDFFECNLDAFKGNSGSPVFNLSTCRVEGMLVEGPTDYAIISENGQLKIQILHTKIRKTIGQRMENCQRLSSLRHLVDKDLLNLEGLQTVNVQEVIVNTLKESYKNKNTISLLLEDPLPIDTIYTELVLLGGTREKEKEEEKTSAFEEHRINSWEDIPGAKEPIALHSLFENRNGRTSKRLLILGGAGIGKSTLCQYIANQWAENKLWKNKFEAIFWVPLRKLQNVHSAETAASVLFRLCCPMEGLFTKNIAEYLQMSPEKILFVLDGLDEITLTEDSQQKKILHELLKFPYWIVTSRPHAAGTIQADDTIENVGYTSNTIDLYIQRSFQEGANAIIQKLRQNPLLFGFCHIPINLELICTILKKSKGDLSTISSMTSLYKELTITLQKRFLEKIGRPDVWDWTPQKLQQDDEIKKKLAAFDLLEAIAWTGMQNRQLIFSLNNDNIEKLFNKFPNVNFEHLCISGFLQSSQDSDDAFENQYSFLHLTFQEFFAARHLIRLFHDNPKEAIQCIHDVKFNPRYKVVMWFTAGLLKDDLPRLNAFFEALEAPKDLVGLYGILLKIRCLEECGCQEKLQNIKSYEKEIEFWLEKMSFKKDDEDDPILKFLIETFEISSKGATRLFIPKICSYLKGVVDKRKGAVKTLGKIGQIYPKATILPLLKALQAREGIEHAPADALDHVVLADPNTAIPALLETLENKDPYVRKEALTFLGRIGHVDPHVVIPALLKALKDKDSDVRRNATKALGLVGKADFETVIPVLIETLKDEDLYVREAGAKALGELGHINPLAIIPVLLETFTNEDINFVCFYSGPAIEQIGKVHPQIIIPVFLKLLKNKKQLVRGLAANALGKLGLDDPETVIPALLEVRKDIEHNVRAEVVTALCRLIKELPDTIFSAMLEALEDKSWHVRTAVAMSLIQIDHNFSKPAIPNMLEDLKDERKFVRKATVKNLGTIGWADPKAVIPALLESLNDEKDVMYAAKDALKEIINSNPQGVISIFLEALQVKNKFVRTAAAEALGDLGWANPKNVIPALLEFLIDKESDCRPEAIISLSKIGKAHSHLIISPLLKILKEEYSYASSCTAFALGELGQSNPQTIIPALLEASENEGIRYAVGNALKKYNLSSYLKDYPHVIDLLIHCKNLFYSTPLASLITCYKENQSHCFVYSAAITKKCLEENLPIFEKKNAICCYEQGKLCTIDFLDTSFLKNHIENRVPQYPEFSNGMCSIQ